MFSGVVPNLIFGVPESMLTVFPGVCFVCQTVVLLWKSAEDNACSISVFSKRQIGNSRQWFIPHFHPSSNPLCLIKSLESPNSKSQGEAHKPAGEGGLFLLHLNRLGGGWPAVKDQLILFPPSTSDHLPGNMGVIW